MAAGVKKRKPRGWFVRYDPTKNPRLPYAFKNKRFGASYPMKTLTPKVRRIAKAKPGKWVRLTI